MSEGWWLCTARPDSGSNALLRASHAMRSTDAAYCATRRTGTLIALWIMKHYHTKAKETIA